MVLDLVSPSPDLSFTGPFAVGPPANDPRPWLPRQEKLDECDLGQPGHSSRRKAPTADAVDPPGCRRRPTRTHSIPGALTLDGRARPRRARRRGDRVDHP